MRRTYAQPPRERRLPVTVLGATGLVGQRVIALLEGHPWLELAHGVASERRAGARYGDVVRWHVETPPPAAALDLRLEAPDPDGDLRGQTRHLGAASR